MRSRLIIWFAFIMSAFGWAQISVKTNLPQKILINSEINFNAIIWKGPIKNFSKYQMEVPAGVSITEIDCKSGSFTQEENIVKIIWAITPTENEYTIQLKLSSKNVSGDKTIHHKYYYLEKGEKREIEMPAIQLSFVENLAAPETNQSASAKDSTQNNDLQGHEDLKQQVSQLRKDSKEAFEVGEKEKKLAQQRISEATNAVENAKKIANAAKKNDELQKAMAARDKAESDLAVANRILTLAKSLEDNALEIERLNQSLDSVKINDEHSKQLLTENSIKQPENSGTTVDEKPKVDASHVEKVKQNAINKGAKDAKGLYKPITVGKGNLKEVIQQIEQIKKDAREANEVGLKEKKKAEDKLTGAYEALKRADYINDEEEKKNTIEKANADKAKAEKDLEVAAKILTLAKSLEENAIQIEKLNNLDAGTEKMLANSINQQTVAPVVADKSTGVAEKTPEPEKSKTEPEKAETGNDVEKLGELFKEEKKEEPTPVKKESITKQEPKKTEAVTKKPAVKPVEAEPAETTSGLVYKLQVGAFTKTPDKTQFNAIGKVLVVKDGDKYKAFFGNFKSREEAIAKRDQLRAKGLDGFVVMFKDGVRLK